MLFKTITEIISKSSINYNSLALIEVYAYIFFVFETRVLNSKGNFSIEYMKTIDKLCKRNLRLLTNSEEDITEKIIWNRLVYFTNILKIKGVHAVTIEYNKFFANSILSSKGNIFMYYVNKEYPNLVLDVFNKVKIDLILSDIDPIIYKFENKIFNII